MPRRPNPALAVRAVVEGFHRHGNGESAQLQLGVAPSVGLAVELQVNLGVELESERQSAGTTHRLALGGRIVRVMGNDRVLAEVVPTTDRAPRDFSGCWLAELGLEPEQRWPWMLASLTPQPPSPSTVGVFDEAAQRHHFKLACLGDGAGVALLGLATALGAVLSESSSFLPMTVGPFGLWLHTVPPRFAEVETAHELLFASADAIIACDASPSRMARTRQWLDSRPRSIPLIDHPAGATLEATCRTATSMLLTTLSTER